MSYHYPTSIQIYSTLKTITKAIGLGVLGLGYHLGIAFHLSLCPLVASAIAQLGFLTYMDCNKKL